MNRRGFVALMDAMIFTVVLILSLSALLGVGSSVASDDRDVSQMLEDTMSAEVRMTDLDPDGDGSRVRVSDMCALQMVVGGTDVESFLSEALDMFSKGRPYLLEMTFDGRSMTVGEVGMTMSSYAETDVPVTTGGCLHAELTIYS